MKPFQYRLFVVLIFIIVSFSNAQFLSKKEFRLKESKPGIIELNKNYDLTSKTSVAENKSLLFAGTLSFIVPGMALGQFYKEEFVNGGIRLGISGICVLWYLLSPTFSITGDGPSSNQKIYAAFLFTANWLASVVDALIPTKHNNYSKYRKYKLNF